jgi:hypothetical protein
MSVLGGHIHRLGSEKTCITFALDIGIITSYIVLRIK